ncbi:hypothetical protein CFC21_004526 [Triticum aestivum]|uniref:Uncharacterized protein n=2 Tax=Triticum TaxID=4564 RepID=A0A9R0QHP2_TRITD|nr:uncharacterized protein LOC123183285 [Triticum aestivum]KAF6986806.1 hypothetical protein CFC21_004526 [Triticum aestivum]VAH11680.1 unnamed protein product [Triticum turgidum subsp. durum]
MAMAALRCAAGRRLAGGGRLLPPVLGLGRPNLTQAFSSHGKEEAGREVLEQIQEKKEKLYDLILRHGYKRNDGSMCYANVQLMHHLSAHIKPRPESIAWRYLLNGHSFYILWMCLSPGVSAYAIWNIYKAGGSGKNLGAVQQGGDELRKKNCIGQGEEVVAC